uniref:RNA-dependent RNA polymerase n=1 Tax=Rhizoctonia cerealis orthocurvulavirus TaxID=3068670 RepID=A0AA51BS72_9VIRU|nr:MAG: RNA-dependent RNA polymerase [Rhizoctonia cerealis orthocurvulavirus]
MSFDDNTSAVHMTDSSAMGDDAPMRDLVSGFESIAFQGGKNRIRSYDGDYSKKDPTTILEVLNNLPRARTIGRTVEKSLEAIREMKDSEIGSTQHSPSSGSGRNSRSNQKKRSSRREKMSVRQSRIDDETFLREQTKFEIIRVYRCEQRLGKFDNHLSFAPADPIVQGYLRTAEGKIPGFNPDDHCFMNSCGDVQMAHLKMYDHAIREGPDFSSCEDPHKADLALLHAIDWVQDRLELHNKLPAIEHLSLDNVKVNPAKSAGAYYRLQGYKTRGDCLARAKVEAQEAMISLLEGDMVPQRPTRIGGRGKPVKMSQEEARSSGIKKGRAIHMTDTRDHLMLGLTEQPLNDAWKPSSFPISVGRGWMHGDASDFVRKFKFGQQFYCFDAEKFDSSLQPWLIHISITIMRMQFEQGLEEKYDAYWHFVEESLLHSFVFRDDGMIFEKFLGTSSGHNHNSLAQSTCTLIMCTFHVYYANRELEKDVIDKSFDAEGLGDNNFLAETQELVFETVGVRGLRSYMVFGVSRLGTKSFATNVLIEAYVSDETWVEEEVYNSSQYLGKYFRSFYLRKPDGETCRIAVLHRPLKETVVRLLYPEGIKASDDKESAADIHGDTRAERIAGHMIDGYGNPWTRYWVQGLLEYAMRHTGMGRPGYSARMMRRFERLGVEDVETAIDFENFQFEHWLKLVAYRDGMLSFVDATD